MRSQQTSNVFMTTIVDTDAIFAITNPKDALHERAKRMLARTGAATIILSPTTIIELSLTVTRELGSEQAKKVIQHITSGTMRIDMIDAQDVHAATALYYTQGRVGNSLADCFVMTLAKRLRVDCIFSFDKGYSENGFVLIEEFLR